MGFSKIYKDPTLKASLNLVNKRLEGDKEDALAVRVNLGDFFGEVKKGVLQVTQSWMTLRSNQM